MHTRVVMTVLTMGLTLAFLAGCGAWTAYPGAAQPAATIEPATVPTAAPAEQPAAEEPTIAAPVSATAEMSATAASTCPPAEEGFEQIVNPAGGYCFLVPAGYTTAQPTPGQLTVFAPAETEGHRERAFVYVEPAAGQNAVTAADAYSATMLGGASAHFVITRTITTLDGQEAVQLDNLPGQDINRQLIAVSGDRLYRLMFMPASADAGEAYTQMEELYQVMLASFRFLPAQAAVETPVLRWEGEVQGACTIFQILATGDAQVGLCGDTPQTMPFAGAQGEEWAAIQRHFGALDADTPAGHITFQGQGTANGPLWERALATWAGFGAMEASSGRTSASARTVLAWQLGESPDQSGQCRMLLVLAYGYAYANLTPCDGGQAQPGATGWLETGELETLYGWLDHAARVEDAAGYLDSRGSEALNAAEVTEWAAAVYDRLAQTP